MPKDVRLDAELEVVRRGGVVPPEFSVDDDFVVGTEPLVPLLESVLRSVLKLALDFRRISFKNEGAIALRLRSALFCHNNSPALTWSSTHPKNDKFQAIEKRVLLLLWKAGRKEWYLVGSSSRYFSDDGFP